MPQSKYGIKGWPDNLDPRLIDLAMYSNEKYRSIGRPLSKWEHLRLCIKGFLPDNVFSWHRWVDDFGEAWCEHTGIVVWGAGGTTKSGIVGALALFDLMAEPNDTLTVMVTNPLEKHADRCYSKTLYWKAHMPEPWKSMWKIVKSPKPCILTKDTNEGSRRGILCISIDAGESGTDIAKKVGAHAPRTRLILDEGQGLPAEALNIGMNLFIGSTDKKGVVIGNPCSWHGNALGEASRPVDEDTRKIDTTQPDWWFSKWSWDDNYGKTLVFDGLKSPSLDSLEENKRLFFMPQQSDIDSRRRMPGGENTPDFWSQVRGRVPPAGAVTTLLSEMDWDTFQVSQRRPFKGPFEIYTGTDLSLGVDKIPVYKFGVGQVEDMGTMAVCLGREYITVNVTSPDKSGQIAKAFNKLVCAPSQFNSGKPIPLSRCAFDCSGGGGSIADRVELEVNGLTGHQRVHRIRADEGCSERVVSNGRVKADAKTGATKRETAKERYDDRATELVMNIVEVIQAGLLCGLDDDVRMQLTSRGYDQQKMEKGQLKIQKKKEWRESHKGQSPDELDSVACAITMLLEKKIIVPGKDTVPKADKYPHLPQWQRPDNKPRVLPRSSRVSIMMRGR